MGIERFIKQHIAEYLPAVVRNLGLLPRVAMVLEAEYHRVVGRLEGTLCYRFQYLLGTDFWDESVPVHDHRLVRAPVPEIQLYTSV